MKRKRISQLVIDLFISIKYKTISLFEYACMHLVHLAKHTLSVEPKRIESTYD
jgi:hypothetical protein